MIESFPNWREISLHDKQDFAAFAQRERPVVSELSFANLYVWRLANRYELSILDGALCVLARPADRDPFVLPPLGSNQPARTTDELFAYLKDIGCSPSMHRVPEMLAHELQNTGFHTQPDRNNSDYVYLARDLINLAGRRYSKKRNQISQFRARHEYEYRRIGSDLIPQSIELQRRWCETRDCFTPGNTSLAEENRAILQALEYYESLGLVGGAILVEGVIQALTIGGRLNGDTMAVHFEKGNPDFPGIYQVVNQAFCADVCNGYTYVNREQDLGDPGLRQAKKSYYPHHMVSKYIVRPG